MKEQQFHNNAPKFELRLESAEIAQEYVFNISFSAELLLDELPYELVRALEPFLSKVDYDKDIGTIWIGLLKIKYIPVVLRKGRVKQELKNFSDTFLKFEHFYQYCTHK